MDTGTCRHGILESLQQLGGDVSEMRGDDGSKRGDELGAKFASLQEPSNSHDTFFLLALDLRILTEVNKIRGGFFH